MLHVLECKTFVQQLLEPNVELRMKIEEAARHRWVKRPGMRMKAHPLLPPEPKVNREVILQFTSLSLKIFINKRQYILFLRFTDRYQSYAVNPLQT